MANSTLRTPIPTAKEKGPSWFWIVASGVCQIWVLTAFLGFFKLKAYVRNRNHEKYRAILVTIGDRDGIPISELARMTGRDKDSVTRSLRQMISKNYLGPEAYLDHGTGMLWLVSRHGEASAYKTDIPRDAEEIISEIGSMAAEFAGTVAGCVVRGFKDGLDGSGEKKGKGSRGKQGSKPKPEPQPEPKPEPKQSDNPKEEPAREEEAIPTDANGILRQLRELNDRIDNDEVSAKIDRIGEITRDIFAVVREHPERAQEVNRFMNYYLPTTLKLLRSYSLLEKQSYQGENIVASRRKIEEIMDGLITAFEKQLDRLFTADAVDISSDIDVLETMMAKDGLDGKGIRMTLER